MDDLKTIDKVLALISIIAYVIAIFYQPIMIESTILFIFCSVSTCMF